MGRLHDDGLQRSLLRGTAAVTQDAEMLRSTGLLPTVELRLSTLCWSVMMSPMDRRRADQLVSWLTEVDVAGLRADKGLSGTLSGRFAITATVSL